MARGDGTGGAGECEAGEASSLTFLRKRGEEIPDFCLEVKKDESKSFAFSCLCDFFSLLLQKKKYGEIENI